ncbi:hypothetical protein XTGART2_1593 [Xanthomonas translucens pv. graminis]|nr:hypothetical protein [Xanthomonas translucens]SBV41357.1 hypothetical protein XTGART2_1593 [Xanthomonas translucens pv. graminis]
MSAHNSLRSAFGCAALVALLVACKAEPSTTAEASISPYNHTEDYIHQL